MSKERERTINLCRHSKYCNEGLGMKVLFWLSCVGGVTEEPVALINWSHLIADEDEEGVQVSR